MFDDHDLLQDSNRGLLRVQGWRQGRDLLPVPDRAQILQHLRHPHPHSQHQGCTRAGKDPAGHGGKADKVLARPGVNEEGFAVGGCELGVLRDQYEGVK